MHPSVVSDKPGDCPICGMRLVPLEQAAPKAVSQAPAASTATAAVAGPVPVKKTMYRSTMNPGEVSDKPGPDSMGMDMVPFEVEAPAAEAIPGLASISISAAAQKQMSLSTSTVEMRRILRNVRTSARITPDETRLHHVTVKIEGWVESLYVNATGQLVRRGQPLLTIYSPELLETQEEYLTARSAAKRLSGSPVPGVAQGGSDLARAARRRLELWDLSDGQIKALETSGKASRTVILYAPASGYVSEKNVAMGHKIMLGEVLLTISDLSTVWAEADIYESDLRFIKVGMPVTLTLPYWPGKTFPGKISFLNPFLDQQTRTLQARLEVPNPELLLKPEMYGDMTLSYDLGERLAVPGSAVMRTGKRDLAFVQTDETQLTPVQVTVGERSGDYYEVLSGLKPGDRVVTSANFLVDSESSLKAALQAVADK
jgi:multidrug efflux pump subunit AcrA (membrane-fusion protein)